MQKLSCKGGQESEEELPSALRGSNAYGSYLLYGCKQAYIGIHVHSLYVANGELATSVAGEDRRTKTEYYMPAADADIPRTLGSKMALRTELHDARRSIAPACSSAFIKECNYFLY